MEPRAAAAWIVAIALGIGVMLVYPNVRALWACDRVIQSELKAPSTYRRLSPSWYEISDPPFVVEYEAENSFGVPLRQTTTCDASEAGH